jgi:SAM-dependent methyltransferase
MLFDEPYYLAINEARWAVLERMIAAAEPAIGQLGELADLGCGPGWFSDRLVRAGRKVIGYEGRDDLVAVARARVPAATFAKLDMDVVGLDHLPPAADAVVCFGLLYHLENPLRALRICRALGRKAAFVETMTIPEPGAGARMIPENDNITQGMRPAALVLTPDAIVHGLTLAGFAHVYRYVGRVDHADFSDSPGRRKRRDIFLAIDAEIAHPDLRRAMPPVLSKYPYAEQT